jgi:Mn-dependent DtxR family transcriptional regulator
MKYHTTIEEYIEIIGKLLSENPVARVKDIASARGVSMPSASSALEKLKSLGLVEHKQYGYVLLTQDGYRLAHTLETSHSTIKDFMVKVLGLPEAIADSDACKFEHHISAPTQNAMLNLMRLFDSCRFNFPHQFLQALHQCDLFSGKSENCQNCSVDLDFSAQPQNHE